MRAICGANRGDDDGESDDKSLLSSKLLQTVRLYLPRRRHQPSQTLVLMPCRYESKGVSSLIVFRDFTINCSNINSSVWTESWIRMRILPSSCRSAPSTFKLFQTKSQCYASQADVWHRRAVQVLKQHGWLPKDVSGLNIEL